MHNKQHEKITSDHHIYPNFQSPEEHTPLPRRHPKGGNNMSKGVWNHLCLPRHRQDSQIFRSLATSALHLTLCWIIQTSTAWQGQTKIPWHQKKNVIKNLAHAVTGRVRLEIQNPSYHIHTTNTHIQLGIGSWHPTMPHQASHSWCPGPNLVCTQGCTISQTTAEIHKRIWQYTLSNTKNIELQATLLCFKLRLTSVTVEHIFHTATKTPKNSWPICSTKTTNQRFLLQK